MVLCLTACGSRAAAPPFDDRHPSAHLLGAARAAGMLADSADLRLAITLDVHGQCREWLMALHADPQPPDLGEDAPAALYSSVGYRFDIPHRRAAISIRLLGPVDGTSEEPPPAQEVRILVVSSYLELGLARGAAFWLRAKALGEATAVPEEEKLNLEFASQPFPAQRVAQEQTKARKRGPTWDEQSVRDIAMTCLACGEFFTLVERTAPLRSLLREALPFPSLPTLVGMIWSQRLSISLDASEVTAADPQAWLQQPGPAVFSLPATLTMNGTPLLRARFMVTEPRPPLDVVAGIVGIETEGVRDPGRRLRIRLLRPDEWK